MKKLLLGLFLALAPSLAWAQCTGVFPANTVCGNLTGSPAPPSAQATGGLVVGPGSSVVGDIATWNNTAGTSLADPGISLASQAAKLFLATPTGGSGAPSFRATQLTDLPAIAASTLYGNFTGGSTTPTAVSVPSCANDGFHTLTNNAAGGFNCTIIEPIQSISSGPATISACGIYWLSGNLQYTVTLNAASTFQNPCNITLSNIETVASGRGKRVTIPGFSGFWLYPGQTIVIRGNGTSFATDKLLNGQFGFTWFAAPRFFVDSGGSNTNNDGLASGASGAFATKAYCAQVAYAQVYTNNGGSVRCSTTAGAGTTEFVQVFYPLNGGGTLIFDSSSSGTAAGWTCPSSSPCLQFGDNALVGLTDMSLVANASSPQIVSGHQYGVLDVNTNVTFTGSNGSTDVIACDFFTHFNINNGITYLGTLRFLFNGCPGSMWNINNAINPSGTVTLGRPFNFTLGSHAEAQGNVTWSTTGLTTSVGLVSGGAVFLNLGGALPGGAPTPTGSASTGWSAYCTAAC